MVSIITVNYNGWQDTCELIASLKQHETYPYEVIVVDNASAGDDAERIRAAHPEAKVVRSDVNLGFAGGNNLGYRYAKGDCIFFLNNDMVVKEAVLQPLVRQLEVPGVGALSPCIRLYRHPEAMQYCGYQDMTPITLRHTTRRYEHWRAETFLRPFVTEVMHGAAMLVRRDVIERVGTMTEVYFLFYEEFDWSRRIREAGFAIWCVPGVSVYHKESMSIPLQTPFREYHIARSRMIYARRNNRGVVRLLSCGYLLGIALPKRVCGYLARGRWSLMNAVLRGTWKGLFFKTTMR